MIDRKSIDAPGAGLFRRMRSVACRYWGVAPPYLDAMVDSGQLSLCDVTDLIWQLVHDPVTACWLVRYLYPEAADRVEHRQKREKWEQQQAQLVAKFGLRTQPDSPVAPQRHDTGSKGAH